MSVVPPENSDADKTPTDKEPTPKILDRKMCVEIPKIIHFIWVGNPLPKKYKKRIIKWKKMNPNHEIKLWIDRDLLTKEQLEDMKNFSEENKITLVDIVDKIDDKNNEIWNKQDLNVYYDSVVGENRNWGMASNVLRMLILQEEGGLYLDTDISAKKPLNAMIAPPHGLLLRSIFSPIDDISTALADNIMASTKNNPIIKEMLKVLNEKYAKYLESNESVLEMRSHVLSDVVNPTYKIVGPDVLAEAYVNFELNRMPFGHFLNRDKIKDKIIDEGFFNDLCEDFFDDYFIEAFDNTWVNKSDNFAVQLNQEFLSESAIKPLLEVLNKIEKESGELNIQFDSIKKILNNNHTPEVKVEEIYGIVKQDPYLLKELQSYMRSGYLSAIAVSYSQASKNLDQLFDDENPDAFFVALKKYVNNYRNFIDLPRKFSNPILNEAAKMQAERIKKILDAAVQEKLNNFLLVARYNKDEHVVIKLLEMKTDLLAKRPPSPLFATAEGGQTPLPVNVRTPVSPMEPKVPLAVPTAPAIPETSPSVLFSHNNPMKPKQTEPAPTPKTEPKKPSI